MAAKDTGNKIRNVGPKSAAWLRQVGVKTQEDLVRLGPVDAFMKVKRAGFRPSLNLLYALAGAVDDCHWADLPDDRKSSLLLAAGEAESANPIKTRWQKQSEASERGAPRDEASNDDASAEPEAESEDDHGVSELTGTKTDFE
jgi:DNA transformation protein and related proteins